ncbi:MAG TPA: ATP synthase F1 subunit delta [Gemmatimonadales bacterium]
MKDTTIARNYAEALFAAAEATSGRDAVERFGRYLDAVAGAIAVDERIAAALESPRVAKAVKTRLLAAALGRSAPVEVVRFLQAAVRRGRQGLFAEMSLEYQKLVDVKVNRVHAGVTLATPSTAVLEKQIVARLTKALGKDVRAHFRTDRAILGGVVVRVGDRIYDGSLKRRLTLLRRRMVSGE